MKSSALFKKELLLLAIVLVLMLVIGHGVLPPCDRFFRDLDRPYDFTLEVGGRRLSGNSGNPFGYSLIYLIPLFPEGVNFSLDFHGMTFEGNSRSYTDRTMLVSGAYEKGILYFMRDTMRALAPDGGTFMDAGANTGQHSLFMSPYVARIHAFEPWKPVLRRFERMIEINGVKNIVVHPVGLGERRESLPFFEPPGYNLGMGSFVEGFAYELEYSSGELQIVPGDNWLAECDSPGFELIKMDVEGFEKPALKGLRQTLISSRPVIVVEVTPGKNTGFQNEEDLMSVLPDDYGYLEIKEDATRRCQGFYELVEYTGEFEPPGQPYLVLFPLELKGRIPAASVSDEGRC